MKLSQFPVIFSFKQMVHLTAKTFCCGWKSSSTFRFKSQPNADRLNKYTKKSLLFKRNHLESLHEKLSNKQVYKFTNDRTTESSTGPSAADNRPKESEREREREREKKKDSEVEREVERERERGREREGERE